MYRNYSVSMYFVKKLVRFKNSNVRVAASYVCRDLFSRIYYTNLGGIVKIINFSRINSLIEEILGPEIVDYYDARSISYFINTWLRLGKSVVCTKEIIKPSLYPMIEDGLFLPYCSLSNDDGITYYKKHNDSSIYLKKNTRKSI